MVRDVLDVPWHASRGYPPDGVRATRERPHEEVVSLLGAWTQDQFGHFRFLEAKHITRRQLHVEDRRLAAPGAGEEPHWLRNLETVDPDRDGGWFRAAS